MATTLTRRIGYKYGQFNSSSLIMSAALTTAPPVASGTTLLTCPVVSASVACLTATLTTSELILSPGISQGSLVSHNLALSLGVALTGPALMGEYVVSGITLGVGLTSVIASNVSGALETHNATVAAGAYVVNVTAAYSQMATVNLNLAVTALLVTASVTAATCATAAINLLAYDSILPATVTAAVLQEQFTVVPGAYLCAPTLLLASAESYHVVIESSLVIASPIVDSSTNASVVNLSSGGVALLPDAAVASVLCVNVSLLASPLSLVTPVLNGQLVSYDVATATELLVVTPNATTSSLSATAVVTLPGAVVCAADVTTASVALRAVVVTPGNIRITSSALTGEIAADRLLVLAAPVSLITPTLLAEATGTSAEVARQLILDVLALHGTIVTSTFTSLATLDLPMTFVSSALSSTSLALTAVLNLALDTLIATSAGIDVVAVPGTATIVVASLDATVESLTVIVTASYFGIYADTPFVATTGSMFE